MVFKKVSDPLTDFENRTRCRAFDYWTNHVSRWVVQEIALSPSEGQNMVYCGKNSVLWQDFADAVSLFVEVETATHRLSDVMKKAELTKHIPDYFGDVSTLGMQGLSRPFYRRHILHLSILLVEGQAVLILL